VPDTRESRAVTRKPRAVTREPPADTFDTKPGLSFNPRDLGWPGMQMRWQIRDGSGRALRWAALAAAVFVVVLFIVAIARGDAPPLVATGTTVNGHRLQSIVDALAHDSSLQQHKQFGDALGASGALAGQLNAAAEAGRLTGIEISAERPSNQFAATILDKHIVLAADFLPQLGKQRTYDVVLPDDILPDNLVFVLGAFASWLVAPPVSPDLDLQSYTTASLNRNARGFIQGWNDVVDAAVRQNGKRPLSMPQAASLMMNLRYRVVFTNPTASNAIKWSPTGTIDPTEQNIAAVADGLRKLKLLDFGH
jgi:hypothetical protein